MLNIRVRRMQTRLIGQSGFVRLIYEGWKSRFLLELNVVNPKSYEWYQAVKSSGSDRQAARQTCGESATLPANRIVIGRPGVIRRL